MGRKEFIEAWNRAFFHNGKLNDATTLDIEVKIAFSGGTVQFTVQGVTPKTRINELARVYADALQEHEVNMPVTHEKNPVPPEEEVHAEPANNEDNQLVKKVIANEHISYRKNSYLVQHYQISGQDFHNIYNEKTGASISPSSIVGRSILKLYRAKNKAEEEE